MEGGGLQPGRTGAVWLAVGVAVGLSVGLLAGDLVFAHATSSSPPPTFSVPSGLPPVSSCFGGGTCGASNPTTNGSGFDCVISGFAETMGDYLYVAVNYAGGIDMITSVSDGGADSFHYVAGEFANNQSVAFYDVPSDHGGLVTITVMISASEFGACTAGQLTPGTEVGVVGPGGSVASASYLSVSNAALHEPSLLMALFGATRPTGTPYVVLSAGVGIGWLIGSQWTGSTYDGTAQTLYGVNDGVLGTVTFTWVVGNTQTPSISAVVVELYLGA